MKKLIVCMILLSFGFCSHAFSQDWGDEQEDCSTDPSYVPDPTSSSTTFRDGNDLYEEDCTTTYPDCQGNGGGTTCTDTYLGTYDCNGDLDGTAFFDDCGKCVEGNTTYHACQLCSTSTFSSNDMSISKVDASQTIQSFTWGLTTDEGIDVTIDACTTDGVTYHAVLVSVTGNYSSQAQLISGVSEVATPGSSTSTTFCNQITDLRALSRGATTWYTLNAVKAHQAVYVTALGTALKSLSSSIKSSIEAITVPWTGQYPADAVNQIRSSQAFADALSAAKSMWDENFRNLTFAYEAEGGVCDQAEHTVVDPLVSNICATATANAWPTCTSCP